MTSATGIQLPTPRVSAIRFRICLAAVIILVLARSAAFVWWPDVHFDADQAVTGLMAKHLAEGRAFPVFQYAQEYVLVLESWLAAPLFAVVPDSVTLLKSVPVALNVATAVLLFLTLTSAEVGVPLAFLATLPVALPGPMTAGDLTDALGMNIEPLLFAVLLWRWRERPVALGIAAAVGMKNREFTLYAIAALMTIDVLRGIAVRFWRHVPPEKPELWRGRIVALVAFAITWAGIGLLKQYSSPFGPGTAFGILAEGRGNMSVATAAMCIVPSMMPGDLWTMATQFLPLQLGLGNEQLQAGRVTAQHAGNYVWLWPPIALLLVFGTARGLLRAWRQGPSPATWVGLYLLIVGLQAVLVYALTRCGHVSVFTLRYTLLGLLAPAGAIVLALEREPRASLRAVMTGGIVLWASVCGFAHARLLREYVTDPPRSAYRELAHYLDARDIRFIVTDYWTGYQIAFLTAERVQPLTDFERVHDYSLAVRANLDRAVDVRRSATAPCAGTLIADVFCVRASAASTPAR